MSRGRRGNGLVVALLACVVCLAAPASAQERCDETSVGLELPLDGSPIYVNAEEIELRGTVDSIADGSVLDAFARRSDGRSFVAEGPFVGLPMGSELVHEDVAAHRYRVRLPHAGPHAVTFAIGRIASAQLRTRSETLATLRGRLEVCALRAPGLVVGDVVVESAGASGETVEASAAPFVGGAALLGLFGFAGLFARRRRSRDAWPKLERRADRAVRASEREVARLGPAFAPVASGAAEVLEVFRGVRAHAAELQRAVARIGGEGREAATRRDALRAEAAVAVARGEGLVERLEGTAASLAAELAEQHRVRDIDERAVRLGRELELAVAADREARAEV
ncbi:MAG: hypothetical protein H6724_06125 [Sandaracinus sp.]|nr:hypothetical protein [Sandaracinus sp.]MCB9624743.1 hypothetical protein [Sandaracinus sp.]